MMMSNPNNHLRIVSLIASATEITCALGLGNFLVGRSHECDYPESVKALPICTVPKFRTDGTSYEIDQRVKAIVQESLSVYRVDSKELAKLNPTHIITQDQCEVCAVSLKDVQSAVCELIVSQPQVISLKPSSLSDIWNDIAKVGTALGVQHQAKRLIATLQKRMLTISNITSNLPKPSVACIEWIDPLMAAGNWMPELIELAGGRNLFGQAGKHSPWMLFEEIVEADPDLIIVTPCGFDIERTKGEMHFLEKKNGWSNLKAVQNQKVFICDGNKYFNRPGPHIVESLEILSELIHPDLFMFGHESYGWKQLKRTHYSPFGKMP